MIRSAPAAGWPPGSPAASGARRSPARPAPPRSGGRDARRSAAPGTTVPVGAVTPDARRDASAASAALSRGDSTSMESSGTALTHASANPTDHAAADAPASGRTSRSTQRSQLASACSGSAPSRAAELRAAAPEERAPAVPSVRHGVQPLLVQRVVGKGKHRDRLVHRRALDEQHRARRAVPPAAVAAPACSAAAAVATRQETPRPARGSAPCARTRACRRTNSGSAAERRAVGNARGAEEWHAR